jgi:rubrerythrin
VAGNVIFARVPEDVKEATEEYAKANGMTLTNAVKDLIDRGLTASQDEGSVAALEARVAELSTENAIKDQTLRSANQTLFGVAERLHQSVCRCPHCDHVVTGRDVLVDFKCPTCGGGLVDLFQSGATPGNTELVLFLASVGAILGVMWLATRS